VSKPALCAALLFIAGTGFPVGQGQTSKEKYQIYAVGGDVKAPRPVSTPLPPTPESIDKNLKVRLSFVVAPDGSVAQVRLLKHARPDFDDFALKVVGDWRFQPATKDGKPVAVRLETEMHSHRRLVQNPD
jgi:TonB family protein